MMDGMHSSGRISNSWTWGQLKLRLLPDFTLPGSWRPLEAARLHADVSHSTRIREHETIR